MKSLSSHFDELLDLPEAQRASWLAELAAQDPQRAAELAEMLAADQAAGPGTGSAQLPQIGAALVGTLFEGRQAAFDALGFRALRLLGRGGMGEVWLVSRTIVDRTQQLALKLLQAPPGEATADLWLQRFRTEQQILLELNHPGIARLIDAGETAGQPWIAMEFVDGLDLVRWCDQQRLDVPGRLRLFQQVCAAVQYAHDRLIVHRDLKPANVLVGADGQPKLLDFGIAKLLGAEGAQAQTGTAQQMFSLYGVAPEQLQGQRATVGTDVYALGALLYELLCGKPALALDGLSGFAAIESRVLHETPTAPSASARTLPPEVAAARGGLTPEALARALRGDTDRIVLHALRKQPGERYASARDFSADIERLLKQEAVHATGQNRVYRARKFLRRHRWGALSIAVVLAMLVGFIWQLRRERDASEVARVSAEQVSDFMVRLFEVSDPTMSGQADMTVAALLRENVQRFGKEELDPRVLGRVLTGLARAAWGIGDAPLQSQILGRLRKADAWLQPADRLERDLQQAQLDLNEWRDPDAHRLLEQLLAPPAIQAMSPAQRERLEQMQVTVANRRHDYAEVVRLVDQRPVWGLRVAANVSMLKVEALVRLKQVEVAERYNREVLERLLREHAAVSGIIEVQLKLAWVLALQHQQAEALDLLERAIERARTEVRNGIQRLSHELRAADILVAAGQCGRAVTLLHGLANQLAAGLQVDAAKRFSIVHNFIVVASECAGADRAALAQAVPLLDAELERADSPVVANTVLRDKLRIARLRLLVLLEGQGAARRYASALQSGAVLVNDARKTQLDTWLFVLAAAQAQPEPHTAQERLELLSIDDVLLKQALRELAARQPVTILRVADQ